jgi:hypothetical protein
LLDDDVQDGAPFQCPDVRVDPAKAFVLVIQGLFDLGLPQPEHPPQFLYRYLTGEGLPDLFQAEAEVAQGHDRVQLAQLLNAVQAVPTGRPDLLGNQQAKLVVVPQHARRHLAEPGELSDGQHVPLIRPDTVRRSRTPAAGRTEGSRQPGR